jgi:hypothetical protein
VVYSFPWNPSEWDIVGKTTAFTLLGVGRVTVGTLTGTVEVYDITDTATVGSITFTSTTVTEQSQVLTFDAARHLYEVYIYVTGATPPDYFVVSATLEIAWV